MLPTTVLCWYKTPLQCTAASESRVQRTRRQPSADSVQAFGMFCVDSIAGSKTKPQLADTVVEVCEQQLKLGAAPYITSSSIFPCCFAMVTSVCSNGGIEARNNTVANLAGPPTALFRTCRRRAANRR